MFYCWASVADSGTLLMEYWTNPTRRCCYVESTSLTLIQRHSNTVCRVTTVASAIPPSPSDGVIQDTAAVT